MTILRVEDASDERLELFSSLTNHQLRSVLDPARAIVVVESEIAIRVALARGLEPVAFLLSEGRLRSLADVLADVADDVPVFLMGEDAARGLTGYAVTRGALCAMRRPGPRELSELVDGATRVVVVEGVSDTANVGAIFRSAAALGADAVICAPSCADPLSRRSVRVSMGNVFNVAWARGGTPWPGRLMGLLADGGFCTIALALREDAVRLDDERLKGHARHALFLGSEGSGLTPEVVSSCDYVAKIPMASGVDSLNVAATSAVALWELFGRR